MFDADATADGSGFDVAASQISGARVESSSTLLVGLFRTYSLIEVTYCRYHLENIWPRSRYNH